AVLRSSSCGFVIPGFDATPQAQTAPPTSRRRPSAVTPAARPAPSPQGGSLGPAATGASGSLVDPAPTALLGCDFLDVADPVNYVVREIFASGAPADGGTGEAIEVGDGGMGSEGDGGPPTG